MPGRCSFGFLPLLPVLLPAAPCDVAEYYASVDLSLTGADLETALHIRVQSPHTVIPYTSSATDAWDALKVLDADPNNAANVLLVYSRSSVAASLSGDASSGWNREHVWPKSYGVDTTGPDTSDLHCLRAADWNVNSARNNLYFDDCTSGCTAPAHAEAAPDTAKNSEVFMPPAEVRGDLARCLFYMTVRYDGAETNTEHLQLTDCPNSALFAMGSLSTLLRWHTEDPVDAAEQARNSRLCTDYQGNRNPFVDHPALVAQLFANYSDPVCNGGSSAASPTPSGGPAACGSLSPGDIVVVAMNADTPDSLSLLLLRDLVAGSQFSITDNGWQASSGTWRASEGVWTYTVPAGGHVAGTVVTWHKTGASGEWSQGSGTMDFSGSGDQAFVYEDCGGSYNFLFGLNNKGADGAWQAEPLDATSSTAPATLGRFAMALSHKDNFAYAGSASGTVAELQSAILDVANWQGDNTLAQSPPATFAVATTTLTATTTTASVTTTTTSVTTVTTITTVTTVATTTMPVTATTMPVTTMPVIPVTTLLVTTAMLATTQETTTMVPTTTTMLEAAGGTTVMETSAAATAVPLTPSTAAMTPSAASMTATTLEVAVTSLPANSVLPATTVLPVTTALPGTSAVLPTASEPVTGVMTASSAVLPTSSTAVTIATATTPTTTVLAATIASIAEQAGGTPSTMPAPTAMPAATTVPATMLPTSTMRGETTTSREPGTSDAEPSPRTTLQADTNTAAPDVATSTAAPMATAVTASNAAAPPSAAPAAGVPSSAGGAAAGSGRNGAVAESTTGRAGTTGQAGTSTAGVTRAAAGAWGRVSTTSLPSELAAAAAWHIAASWRLCTVLVLLAYASACC